MMTKQDILNLYKKEFATSLKVMRAYPPDKLTFNAHERSKTAGEILSIFNLEMYLIKSYVFNDKQDIAKFKNYKTDNLQNLIADFERESAKVYTMIDNMNESDLTKEFEFAGKKFTAGDFIIMMLFDQIHHRGQMSVYIRLAGGKVPSIYGPSADDPTTNL